MSISSDRSLQIKSLTIPNKNSNETSVNLKRVALISALGIVQSLLTLSHLHELSFQQTLQPKTNLMGFVNPSCINEPPVIDTLQAYLPSMLHQADEVLEGAFHFIVDTGCSLSASPFKADFESLQTLQQPVTLHCIAGNSTVTQGGIL